MPEPINKRQKQILKLLLENKNGLSINDVRHALRISRTAVQQHFHMLDREGLIATASIKKTAGRPVRTYTITPKGINLFPKQYAWFSELILDDLKQTMGAEALRSYFEKLGLNLAHNLSANFDGRQPEEKLAELIGVMDSLGFEAAIAKTPENNQTIEACNCIYHDLAQKHQEVCEFDKALIKTLLEVDADLTECMAKGNTICRFVIRSEKKTRE